MKQQNFIYFLTLSFIPSSIHHPTRSLIGLCLVSFSIFALLSCFICILAFQDKYIKLPMNNQIISLSHTHTIKFYVFVCSIIIGCLTVLLLFCQSYNFICWVFFISLPCVKFSFLSLSLLFTRLYSVSFSPSFSIFLLLSLLDMSSSSFSLLVSFELSFPSAPAPLC